MLKKKSNYFWVGLDRIYKIDIKISTFYNKIGYEIIKYYKYKPIYEHLKKKIGHDKTRTIVPDVYNHDKKRYKRRLPKKIHNKTRVKISNKPYSLFRATFICLEDKNKNHNYLCGRCVVERLLGFYKFCNE